MRLKTHYLVPLLLALGLFISCWPAHAGVALPGANYVHRNQFAFAAGVEQHYTSPTADLIVKVKPATLANARVAYLLTPTWRLEGEMGRQIQSSGFKLSQGGDWHAKVGAYWSFSF